MVRLFFFLSLLWPFCSWSIYVVEQEKLSGQFSQPVAVSVDEGKKRLAVLDLEGLSIISLQNGRTLFKKKVSSSALSIFHYQDVWFVADPKKAALYRLNAEGNLIDTIDVKSTENAEHVPEPVAVGVYQDIVYWADRGNHRICMIDLPSLQPMSCFGGAGEKEDEFQFPYQIVFDRDGYLNIVDVINGRVQVFDKRGRYTYTVGRFGTSPTEMFRPNGIASDTEHDLIFVSESYFGDIRLYRAGKPLGILSDFNGERIRFKTPTSLAWHDNALYVADTWGNAVVKLKLTEFGTYPKVASRHDEADMSQKNCLICHLSWAKEGNEVDGEGVWPEASYAMCFSCHNGAVWDSRVQIGRGAQHATIYDESAIKKDRNSGDREDKMPKQFPHTHENELPCSSCHTPHTKADKHVTLYQNHNNSWLRLPNEGGDLCEKCHESKVEAAREEDPKKRGINHPLAIKLLKPPVKNAPGFARDSNLHKGLPKALAEKGRFLSDDEGLICQTCHQIHGGHDERALVSLPHEKAELCSVCHERQSSKDEKDARKKGIHPVNIKPEKPIKHEGKEITFVTCENCHVVHDGNVGTALLPKEVENSEALCPICHKRQHEKGHDEALEKGIHPVDFELEDEVEIAGKKIKQVGCLTCHSVHEGKPNTPALVEDHKDGTLCEYCHAGKRTVVGSDHDLRITAKDEANEHKETAHQGGVCSACHSMHRGENKNPHLYAAKLVDSSEQDEDADKAHLTEDKLCMNCHQKKGIGEEKIVKWFSHPHKSIVLRSDPEIMPLLDEEEKIEKIGEIACITCHDPHFWKPDQLAVAKQFPERVKPTGFDENQEGTPLTSFLRTKGVKGTFCVECHGIEALTKFKYYHDENLVRKVGVDYLE